MIPGRGCDRGFTLKMVEDLPTPTETHSKDKV